MHYWKKLATLEVRKRVFDALGENVDYYNENILGVPASHLDSKVFYQNAPFLQDAPFMSTMIHNPNHIGCHTLGSSESFFKGTQKIEQEVIEICAVDILKGEPHQQDGYVASGGTEANMQAIWIYRNYFIRKYGAKNEDLCILCSEDAHYSMNKAGDVFCVDIKSIPVNKENRSVEKGIFQKELEGLILSGKKYFIVVANMMTTMFGSVDDIDLFTDVLEEKNCEYKLHVDGAYGGFFYPFSEEKNRLDFSNPKVTSVTLDAHKMAQAPYGTGIFLIRKNYLQYANTKEASYVEGEDYTLIGSRSGANAVAIWMILSMYGPFGWKEKIYILIKRTEWFCAQLKNEGIEFFRHPKSNIITIKSKYVSAEIAKEFGLVPDNHHLPNWYKIVVMDHVHIENLIPLIDQLQFWKNNDQQLQQS